MCNDSNNKNNSDYSKEDKIFNGRDEKGRFVKGHSLSTVYEDDIPDRLELYVNTHINDIKLCSIASFCHENGIHIPTFYGWIARTEDARYDQLRIIHAHFMAMQKQQIIDGAINRTFDPSFAQFLLKAQHGLRDKQEISLDSKSEGTLDVNINIIK